jgi:hypothetical protein
MHAKKDWIKPSFFGWWMALSLDTGNPKSIVKNPCKDFGVMLYLRGMRE